MRIIFFGSSEFAVPALKALKDATFDIVAVVTVPDQSAGREHVLTPPPVKVTAEQLGLKVIQPASLKEDTFFEEFKSLSPDLCIVAAYGKIIPERYLSVPRHGFLNIHPSLLPKYRGPTPIQSAILNGDSETGVTIMQIDKDMDHGPILKQITHPIASSAYYQELHNQLAEIGASLLIDTIPKYISGEIKPQEQDHAQATSTKIYSRLDSHIDWKASAVEICNRVRALNPNPGTWTIWKGTLMNIREVRNINTEASPILEKLDSGTVFKSDNKILVASTDGALELCRILLEGKKETTALEFSQGHQDFIGSKFE